MREKLDFKLSDQLRKPEKKKHYNEQLFTVVAPKYDFITRALSLGRDAAWKRHLVDALPVTAQPFCVDLACGTGDVSFLLASKFPRGTVLGLDLTQPMLDIAARRHRLANLRFARQDMCRTGLRDGTADIVTGSYALRNAPDLPRLLDEVHRILKPGGVAAFLDFSRSPRRIWQRLGYWVLKAWGSLWGLALHRNRHVYAYIAESLRQFPDRQRLRQCIRERGFQLVEAQTFYLGLMELLVIRR